MKNLYLLFAALFAVSCGNSADPESTAQSPEPEATYTVVEQDLKILKDVFNANQGRVRLLFLSGPTCGICLRGMADLNDAFLSEQQNDDRLVTFVVHVPTMGAKEKHVAETIPLLSGPRIHHYWEDSGIIGQHFSEVMEVDTYVWDFWTIYGPDVVWEGLLPPKPDYYEHQLGVTSGASRSFPKNRVLDADRFATKTLDVVKTIDGSTLSATAPGSPETANLLGDGTEISVVGQPRNVAVRQHIMLRGGYKNLKRIRNVVATGHLESGDQRFGLNIVSTRPNGIHRELNIDGQVSTAGLSDGGVFVDSNVDRGIPAAMEKQLLASFEFDGMIVEWPGKGHEVSMSGMRKFDDILAWRLELRQNSGPVWYLYVDSHSGDLIEKRMLDENGEPALIIQQSDFREVDGFRFPFRTEYVDRDGQSIAVETLNAVTIDVEPFDVEGETVSH